MDIKKHCQKIFIFIINLLIIILIVFGIKENTANSAQKTEENDTTTPVDNSILQTQSDIATDRENKLRSLNTSPKNVTQTKRTTITTQAPVASSTTTANPPTRKTKTS